MGARPGLAGDIVFRGASIRGRSPETVARSGIALVPEGRRIYADLTVEENLRLGFAGRRTRDGVDARPRVGARALPDRRRLSRPAGRALSGGQQQQLAIARALSRGRPAPARRAVARARPAVVDIVFDALAAIRERGVTVLLVEQRAQRTVAFADRTYVLSNGELVTTSRRRTPTTPTGGRRVLGG